MEDKNNERHEDQENQSELTKEQENDLNNVMSVASTFFNNLTTETNLNKWKSAFSTDNQVLDNVTTADLIQWFQAFKKNKKSDNQADTLKELNKKLEEVSDKLEEMDEQRSDRFNLVESINDLNTSIDLLQNNLATKQQVNTLTKAVSEMNQMMEQVQEEVNEIKRFLSKLKKKK